MANDNYGFTAGPNMHGGIVTTKILESSEGTGAPARCLQEPDDKRSLLFLRDWLKEQLQQVEVALSRMQG